MKQIPSLMTAAIVIWTLVQHVHLFRLKTQEQLSSKPSWLKEETITAASPLRDGPDSSNGIHPQGITKACWEHCNGNASNTEAKNYNANCRRNLAEVKKLSWRWNVLRGIIVMQLYSPSSASKWKHHQQTLTSPIQWFVQFLFTLWFWKEL